MGRGAEGKVWGRDGAGLELKEGSGGQGRLGRLPFRQSPLLAGLALARLRRRGTQPHLSLMASQRRPGSAERSPPERTLIPRASSQVGWLVAGAALGVSQRPCAVGWPRWSAEGKPASLKGDLRAQAGSLGEAEAARQAVGTRSDREGKSPHCSASQVAQH